jgi:hypothetical protein
MEFMDKLKRSTIKDYVTNHQARIISNLAKYPYATIRTCIETIVPDPGAERQLFNLLFDDAHRDGKFGVTNIQVSHLAKLILGGQHYEQANTLNGQFWMTSQGRSIPITKWHDITLEFQFNGRLDPVTIQWDLVEYHHEQPLIQPCLSDTPYEIIQSVNSAQHVTYAAGDTRGVIGFALPESRGMPLAKLSVRFLDGDSDALSAAWIYTNPESEIQRLTLNSTTGYWELHRDISEPDEDKLFLASGARIQYSRMDGKQPPTRADIRLDTWNLTRVMGGMYGAMF